MAWIDTDYAVGEILKELRNSGGTFPTTWYAGLFTTAPNAAGTGGVEVSVGWYSRISFTWAAHSGRTMANSSAVSFATSAASAIPSPVVALGCFDALTSGNLWHILTLTTPLTVGIGSQVNFPIGQIIQEFPNT